ncbi:MAG: hypothetical protein AAF389_10200 [Gemmatimonadota bacterium]
MGRWTLGRCSLLVPAVVVGACSDADEPAGSEPITTPPVVELFAAGAVSTEAPEFATAFSLSSDTVWFNRTPPDRSQLDLFFSVRTPDGWSEGSVFPPLEGVAAIDPFVSFDGERLYFSSSLSGAGTLDGSFNLWWIALGEAAPTPTPMPAPINSDSSDVFNSFARDGRMVFSSRRDGVRAVYEVVGDEARHIPLVEDGRSASNPAIHPTGEILVFASAAEGDPPDLYVSCRSAQGWGAPVRLEEPINSPFTDFAPGFGPGYLYFTSERPGVSGAVPDGVRPPGDVYRTPVGPIERLCSGS